MSKSNLTTADLLRLSKAANRYQKLNLEIAEKFKTRYGVVYSDIPAADDLVEILEYGGNETITLKLADEIMLEAGYPVLKRRR